MASTPTQFKLQRVDTRVGPIALVTMDNGEDWQKPNTFGEAALRSLEGVLDQLEAGTGAGCSSPASRSSSRSAPTSASSARSHPNERAWAAQAGHELFGRLRELPFVTRRGDQRRGARRRRRDRAALRLPHHRVVRAPLRLPGGLPRAHPGLGRHAARAAARRRRASGDVHRREPAPPEPDAATRSRRSRPGFADALLEPVEFLDESIAFLLDKVEEGAGKRRPAADLSDVAEVCRKARSRLDGQVHGATPAPYRALDLIEGAATWSLEEGYRAEEDALAELLPGPQAQASVYAFDLVERRAKRGVGMPDAEPRRVAKVGVVGAGLMARQLALLFLRRLEVPVVLRDLTQEQVDDGDRLDPRRARRARAARAAWPRARRGSSARSSPAARRGTSSPAATSCRGGLRGDGR